jgi:hypothetical protein
MLKVWVGYFGDVSAYNAHHAFRSCTKLLPGDADDPFGPPQAVINRDIFGTALPPDVRRGWASPALSKVDWGYAPGSGFAPFGP